MADSTRAVVSLRLSSLERAKCSDAARRMGETLGEFLRWAGMERASRVVAHAARDAANLERRAARRAARGAK